MQDRRRTKRRFLMYYSRIFDTSNDTLVGQLGDVTPLGLMVISDAPLPVDKVFTLKIELSAEVSDQPDFLVTARSLWCQPDVAPGIYNTGFELQELSPENIEIIQHIVDNFGFRDNG